METVQATEITDVVWYSDVKVIEITLDTFPSTWGNWTMYVDGKEISMEGGVGRRKSYHPKRNRFFYGNSYPIKLIPFRVS